VVFTLLLWGCEREDPVEERAEQEPARTPLAQEVLEATQEELDSITLVRDLLLREDAARKAISMLAERWPAGLQADRIELKASSLTVQLRPTVPLEACDASELVSSLDAHPMFTALEPGPDDDGCLVTLRYAIPDATPPERAEVEGLGTRELLFGRAPSRTLLDAAEPILRSETSNWRVAKQPLEHEWYAGLLQVIGERTGAESVSVESLGWVQHEWVTGLVQRAVVVTDWHGAVGSLDRIAYNKRVATMPELVLERAEGSLDGGRVVLTATITWWSPGEIDGPARPAPWPEYARSGFDAEAWDSFVVAFWDAPDPFTGTPPRDVPWEHAL
jgi:hypothetical protein